MLHIRIFLFQIFNLYIYIWLKIWLKIWSIVVFLFFVPRRKITLIDPSATQAFPLTLKASWSEQHCVAEFARHFYNSRARRLDGHPGRRSSSAGISWMYDQSNPDSNLVDLVRASRPGHNWLTSRAIPWCLLPTLAPPPSYPLSVIYTFNLLEAEEWEGARVERSGHLVDLMVSFGSGLLFQFSHSIRIIKVAAPLCPSSSTLSPFSSLSPSLGLSPVI